VAGADQGALKVDLRSSSFTRANRLGAQARAAGSLGGQIIFYLLMGGFMASLVFIIHDRFLGAAIVIGYVMFMVGTAALLDHNAAIVSPDDYGILGYRPITSRTYFAAKLANVLVYTMAITTLFAAAAHWRDVRALGTGRRRGLDRRDLWRVGHDGAGDDRDLRVPAALDWPHKAQASDVARPADPEFPGLWRLLHPSANRREDDAGRRGLHQDGLDFSLPPTWFASYVDIAAGQTSSFELVPAAVSVGAMIVLVIVLGGRLSLDYAERLSAIVTAARTVTPGRVARKRAAWLFTAGEARAVALLIRGQFKNDMRFRMGVLAILPLTLIYLFMGISNNNGTVGDAFVLGKSAEGLRLVTLAMLMFPTMLKLQVGRSDNFRASWIFFASPVDRTRLVRATRQVLVLGFLLPYIAVVGIVSRSIPSAFRTCWCTSRSSA
jgi:hypothetical protein